jgi:hypothetical protein
LKKENSVAKSFSVPSWWNSKEEQIQAYVDTGVSKGVVKHLSTSPGGRQVKAVIYGDMEPELKGTANFNSAVGARNPDYYFRRGSGVRKRPVMVVLAGVHGQEVEGMAASLSLINIMETGRDLSGKTQEVLYEKLNKLRLIIIPLANPDGRARVPYDGWVGEHVEEMAKYGQGTRKNGELYRWPGCKGTHPMKGDVGILGGYFNDDGVNMMHDDWASPMSETTVAVLKLVSEEGPDMLLNLHSHMHDPSILPTAYIPVPARLKQIEFREILYSNLVKEGYPYEKLPIPFEDGSKGNTLPPLNLTGLFYHVGADMSLTYESPHGVIEGENAYVYDDLLNIHHILFGSAADYLGVF